MGPFAFSRFLLQFIRLSSFLVMYKISTPFRRKYVVYSKMPAVVIVNKLPTTLLVGNEVVFGTITVPCYLRVTQSSEQIAPRIISMSYPTKAVATVRSNAIGHFRKFHHTKLYQHNVRGYCRVQSNRVLAPASRRENSYFVDAKTLISFGNPQFMEAPASSFSAHMLSVLNPIIHEQPDGEKWRSNG